MKDWLNQQLENLRNKLHDKEFLLNAVKVSSLVICLSVLALFRIGVSNPPRLLAHNLTEDDPSVLGVFYKRPEIVPEKRPDSTDPETWASSAVVMDAETFTVLFEQNADEQRPMASTTKIMTALVALRELSPTYVMKIGIEDVAVGGSSMFLVPGEELLLRDLIKGLLIPSGNDAALTLENEFRSRGKDIIEEMNDYALALGLSNTHFVNTSGLDAEGHYSSAKDLAMIASYAMRDYTIRSAVKVVEDIVYSRDGVHGHYLRSTNKLLGVLDGVDGIKTGYTQGAGQCLVASAERNGHRIITVVLDSPDRFVETEVLINWAFENYSWE